MYYVLTHEYAYALQTENPREIILVHHTASLDIIHTIPRGSPTHKNLVAKLAIHIKY